MTEQEMREHCDANSEGILVRDIVNGRVDTYKFSELPEERKKYWVERWTEERRK